LILLQCLINGIIVVQEIPLIEYFGGKKVAFLAKIQ
jgi:hypothetical protein